MKSLQAFKSKLIEEQSDLNETMIASSDYKISASGRKYRAHRTKVGDTTSGVDYSVNDVDMLNPEALLKKGLLKKGEVKLKEDKTIKVLSGDPPFTLVLKRQTIRSFSGDVKIALYFNEQLKTYFSIPYSNKTGSVLPIDQTFESVMESLKTGTINHKDGSSSNITEQNASELSEIYLSLNESNKMKFEDLIEANQEGLKKAIEFSKQTCQ